MSPVRVTVRRTVGMARDLYSTAFAAAGFLCAAASLFAFNLDASEGAQAALPPLWAVSVSPVLPVLAALLGMDSWSDERKTGRIDMLLTAPVRERDLVIGKFLGVWALTLAFTAASLVSTLCFVRWYAPPLSADASFLGFVPAFAALSLQSALWCAFAVAASAFFSSAAAAATATVAFLVALPRGLWYAFSRWAPQGRPHFGSLPVDDHAYDLASGLVSSATVFAYLAFTAAFLFCASKMVSSLRFPGRGARMRKASAWLAAALSLVVAALASGLAWRLDATLDLPVGGTGGVRFSDRTRRVLAESGGSISVTAFVGRADPQFRHLAHFLRALRDEADEVGGVRIELRYVDPELDLAEARRLVRAGVARDSVVFERNGRIVGTILVADGYGERVCASVIERVATPFHRSCVYWTRGHGEVAFDDYGPGGLSDVARDLALDGYANKSIDLAGGDAIAEDCALIVVAGARTEFSAAELARLRAYLEGKRGGGRLLVLTDSAEVGGVPTLLSEWGIRPVKAAFSSVRTVSGSDVIATGFSPDHIVSRPFAGQQAVLERPISFVASAAAAEAGSGADGKSFFRLLDAGGACLAAGSEKGAGSDDLAMRPTRVIAIGDVGFVTNGKLRVYANANRDFFVNAVKYLAGRDAITEAGTEAGRIVSGMDRETRTRFAVASSVAFPSVVFVLFAAAIAKRRRRP